MEADPSEKAVWSCDPPPTVNLVKGQTGPPPLSFYSPNPSRRGVDKTTPKKTWPHAHHVARASVIIMLPLSK